MSYHPPRTNEQIVARIDEVKGRDLFGFERSDLIARLPYHVALPYLQSNAVEQEWKPFSREPADVIAEMLAYMPLAWDRANNCRGLSARRSLSHYSAWIWLAGDDLCDLLDYEFYGKDKLVLICNHYGWDSSEWDDGVRTN